MKIYLIRIDMSKSKFYFIYLLTGLMVCASQPLPAQFLTIARKIKNMKNGDKDVATVILDAGAARVYRAMTDTLSADKRIKISQMDNSKKLVEFSKGTTSFSMQVDSLSAGFSQITVLAVHVENSSGKKTDAAVNAILAVSKKAGIKCEVKDN
jgi:hypothetical protein